MERIISYDDLPLSLGQSVYLRMESDPRLYVSLLSKGYRIVKNISEADESTIYVTGRRQDYECRTIDEYKAKIDGYIESSLKEKGITKPKTTIFSYSDLLEHKYKLPFVLKNENQNGGREKFLIQTEEDYENLINACSFLIDRSLLWLLPVDKSDPRYRVDYDKYLDLNFSVQEYIPTPSKYNTTVRLITTPSNDLLYGALKYKEPDRSTDNTTLLGYLLREVYPLSTPSIVSNTCSGGSNILLGEHTYPNFEVKLLDVHNINSEQFYELVENAKRVHEQYRKELGLICGFDFIYDKEREKWFLLEYHSKPMVGDYSRRQGIAYSTSEDKIRAEGRVRATALSLTLKKTR